MIAWNLATCRWASLLWTSKCIFAMHSLVKNVYWFFAGIRWHSLLLLPLLFLFSWMFILAAISYQLQEYTHRIWVNMVHLSVNLAIRGGSFCSSQIAFLNVKSCQNLVNLGTPFLSSILVQKLPKTKKQSLICWVSHMFSIWKHRYSDGICFGPAYAPQNSTPNISTPNILSFSSLSTPEGSKKCIFYVVNHDYTCIQFKWWT